MKYINTYGYETLSLWLKLNGRYVFSGNLTSLPSFYNQANYREEGINGMIGGFIEASTAAVDGVLAPITNIVPGAANFGNFGKGLGDVLNGAIGLTSDLMKINGLGMNDAGFLTRQFFDTTQYNTYQFVTRIGLMQFNDFYNNILNYILPQSIGAGSAQALANSAIAFLDPMSWLPTQKSIDGGYSSTNLNLLMDMMGQTMKNAITGIDSGVNDGSATGDKFITKVADSNGKNITSIDSTDAMGWTLFSILASKKDMESFKQYTAEKSNFNTKTGAVDLSTDEGTFNTSKMRLVNDFFQQAQEPDASTSLGVTAANAISKVGVGVSSMSQYLSQILATVIQFGLTQHPKQFEYNHIAVTYGDIQRSKDGDYLVGGRNNILSKIVPWAVPTAHPLNMSLKYVLQQMSVNPANQLDINGSPLYYDLTFMFETTQKVVVISPETIGGTAYEGSDGYMFDTTTLYSQRTQQSNSDYNLVGGTKSISATQYNNLINNQGRVKEAIRFTKDTVKDVTEIVTKPLSTLGSVFTDGKPPIQAVYDPKERKFVLPGQSTNPQGNSNPQQPSGNYLPDGRPR